MGELVQLQMSSPPWRPLLSIAAAFEGDNPDAELVRLCAEFQRQYAEYLSLAEETWRLVDAIDERFDPRRQWKDWCRARKESGADAASFAQDAKAQTIDKIVARIRAIPAASMIGVAVKATILPFTICNIRAEIARHKGEQLSEDDLDEWQTEVLHGFIAEVQALAKLEGAGYSNACGECEATHDGERQL